MAAPPYGPGGPGYPAMPPIMSPPRPTVSNPLMSGAGAPGWANPLMYAGLGLLSQGPSLTPQSPLQGLVPGLQMGMQANALAAEQARQNEELKLRREEAAAKREERERLAAGRAEAADVLSQMSGAREMAGPLQPGQTRPTVEGLSPREGALRLMGLPGYESLGAQMYGQETAATRGAEEFDAMMAHRQSVLEETRRHNLEAEAAAAAKLQNTGALGAEGIRSTRSQYEQATRKDRDALKAYETVRNLSASENPTIASDTALIFSLMKTLDPTSTVREGEVATVQNATGVPDRFRNMYNRALGKEGLNAQQRKEIEEAARLSVEPRLRALQSVNETYSGIATRGGANPADIVTFEVPEGLLEAPNFPDAVPYGAGATTLSPPITLIPGRPTVGQAPPAAGGARSILDLPER